jgi:hypothetical protein
LLAQRSRFALAFARASTGKRIDARMPMMAITTSNSINVKPRRARFGVLTCMSVQTLTKKVTLANGKDSQHLDW